MRRKAIVFWILITLISTFTILFSESPSSCFIPGILLMCFLPGFALMRFIFRSDEVHLLEQLCLSIGFSLAISSVEFVLAFHLFGKVTTNILIPAWGFTSIFLLSLNFFRKDTSVTSLFPGWKTFLAVLSLIALASFFRFTHLGYSEYQGDEAMFCLSNSLKLVNGDKSVLFTEKKPPLERIVTTMVYLTFNSYNEFLVKLPFALTSLAGVIVFYLLGRQLFSSLVGITAGILAAINGYFIAFSRIVQYQSIVILCALLSILLLYRFLQAVDKNQITRFLLSGVFFLAFGVFTHYDGAFVLPAAVYIILHKWTTGTFKHAMSLTTWSLLLFALIVSLFYVPFIFNPNFAKVFETYKHSRFSSELSFHYETLFKAGSLYNSLTYIICLVAFSVFAFFRKFSFEMRLLSTWFIFPFVFLMVIVSRPGTHIYNYFLPWLILAAVGLENLVHLSGRHFFITSLRKYATTLTLLGFAVLAITVIYHVYTVFIKHDPEYIWNQPRESIQKGGLFGFPYHRGWKTVGYLYRTNQVRGNYISNEKDKITSYYLRSNQGAKPKYIILVEKPQSWKYFTPPEDYAVSAQVLYKGKPTITIYEDRSNVQEVKIYHSEEYELLYDRLDRMPRG